jgi:hypothetical protein
VSSELQVTLAESLPESSNRLLKKGTCHAERKRSICFILLKIDEKQILRFALHEHGAQVL